MTTNKMKKEFEKLGYELSYDYKCWHIRKHGSTEYVALGCKETAEETLFRMQDELKEIDNLITE